MYSRVKPSSWALPFALLLNGAVKAQELSYIYFDNTPFLANASNVVEMSWPALQAAFASSKRSDVATYSGFDWTQPYPGKALPGFSAHLRIASDVAFPDSVTTEDVTTNVAAISYGIPQSLTGSDGLPKSMDSSWYICQHYYVSTVPDPTQNVEHDCSFLPTQCQDDLKSGLVKGWGSLQDDTGTMCSGNALDLITESCRDALGLVRADVLGWDASYLEDANTAKILTVDEVGQQSWMVGTGFGDPNSPTAYYAASNRTYVVVNVFGHGSEVSNAAEPVAELACLRPTWSALPVPTPTSTSTSSSSKTSAAATSSSSSSSSTTTAPATPTTHCIGGTIRDGVSGNLGGLCSFSCDYDACAEDACVCTKSASAAAPTPTQSGHGCPAASVDKNGDDYAYYVELCEFTCSHGYCPNGACESC